MSVPQRRWLVALATLVVCGLLAGSATASPVPAGFSAESFTATDAEKWHPCDLDAGPMQYRDAAPPRTGRDKLVIRFVISGNQDSRNLNLL